jgi:hypothetical protein
MDWADQMIAVVERSDLIKAATIARSQANYRLAADILDQVVAQENAGDDLDKAYNPDQLRDRRGRWTRAGGAPAEAAGHIANVSGSAATVATRIANIARSIEHALATFHHVRAGTAERGHVIGLMQSLYVLQSELRKLPADARALGYHGRRGLIAARDGILRLKAYVRQLRGRQPGRKKPINKAIDDDAIRRLKRLRRNIARLRGCLSLNNGLQPLEAPVNKSTTPDYLRAFLLKQKISRLKEEFAT